MQIREGIVHFEPSDMAFCKPVRPLPKLPIWCWISNPHTRCPFCMTPIRWLPFFHTSKKKMFTCVKNADCEYRCVTIKKRLTVGNAGCMYPVLHCGYTKVRSCMTFLPIAGFPLRNSLCTGEKSGTECRAAAVKKRFVLTLDITDFFGSIRFDQVYSAAFNARYFPRQIGVMLMALCCRRDVLPQGAPTSPAPLQSGDAELLTTASENGVPNAGVAYTRYCDDIDLSADHPLSSVYCKVKDRLTAMGFALNEKKHAFAESSSRQKRDQTVNES